MTLIKRLQAIVGKQSVLTDRESLTPFECDGLSVYRQLPAAVVMPGSFDEICAVLRICHELKVPVVARGAGTGLSGGALPIAEGVVLNLASFTRILDIDPINRTAVVQTGVRNLAISEAAARYGLYYAPDPSSQIACTIGGNVAENSGGVHCLKYGLTVHNILQVKMATVEGELLTLGATSLDTAGYDLLALITGSEGLLGIILEVTVRLLPKPDTVHVLLVAFDQLEQAGQAVSDIIAAGIIPAGLEMMDNPAIRAAEDFVNAGYPRDAAAILICELDGTQAEVEAAQWQVSELMRKAGAVSIRVAKDDAERQLLWKGRKAAFPAMGRISPDY